MLRSRRDLHRQTGMEQPRAGRRRGAQLRRQRPLLREGPFRRTSGFSPPRATAGGALGAALFV